MQFGLIAIAKAQPMRVPDEQTAPLLRLALFDMSRSADSPHAEVRDMVLERLADAADRHLREIDDFNEWFHSTASNWPSAIASQKRGGGKLDREEVQRVILDLGWASYSYVAQCLQVFAVAFRHSLDETMTAEGKDRIRAVVLSPAKSWRPATCTAIREKRPHRCRGHAAPGFSARRNRDRSFAQVARHLWRHGAGALPCGQRRFKQIGSDSHAARVEVNMRDREIDSSSSVTRSSGPRFDGFAAALAERLNLDCVYCDTFGWRLEGDEKNLATASTFDIQITCAQGHVERTVTLSRDEFLQLAAVPQ